MRYQTKLGKEFPVEVEVVKARTVYVIEVTRSAIALMIAGGSAVALLAAVTFCAFNGGWSTLATVWSVVALPLGWVAGHYFNAKAQTNEERTEK
jgi:hypothetical protein